MFDADPSHVAVKTAQGVDLFVRHQDEGQSRARFECLGTLNPDGTLTRYAEAEGITDEALRALATPLDMALGLGDVTTWPRLSQRADPVRVLLYLDFFRAWQVADMAAARLERDLSGTEARLLTDIGQLPGAIAPLYQFNMTERATALAPILLPALIKRLQQGGIARDRADQAGYGLRMLGDLCLRAGDPAAAQAVFSLSCDLGDNPFRRQKAIEAALAAGAVETARAHAARYAAQWSLPERFADLAPDPGGQAA